MTTPEQTPRNGRSDDKAPQPRGLTRGMTYALSAVAIVVVAGVLVSLALLLSPRPSPAAAPTAASGAAPTQGPVPGAVPTTGSEVQSPAPTDASDGRLPPLTTAAPLVAPPWPASASAEGALVEGFPRAVIAPIDGSDIISSAVASQDATMQVTLVARTDLVPPDVTAHYRGAWAALGATEAAPGDGSSELTFSDQYSTLTLGVTETGTGTVYMIYGVLRAS